MQLDGFVLLLEPLLQRQDVILLLQADFPNERLEDVVHKMPQGRRCLEERAAELPG